MWSLLLGVSLTITFWFFAWTDNGFVTEHSFLPLWLGYILVVNGASEVIFRDSLLRRLRATFLLLFAISIPFWWFFESINLIVENWHYEFREPVSRTEYIVRASINFSTVIPAVLSTTFLFNRILQAWSYSWKLTPLRVTSRGLVWSVLVGAISWSLLPLIPHIAFPFVWIAPILIIEPVLYLLRYPSLLSKIERGEWLLPVSIVLGTLFCGFWWEFWNYYSLPKWIYTIPYLGFWKIFEMPILGYLGYPFFGMIVYSYSSFILTGVLGRNPADEMIDAAK